jgi:hypothetical protein
MATGALAETVVEEVATNLEEVAQATRSIDPKALGYFGIGVGVGLALGFYWGYKANREKIKAEVLRDAEEEIKTIREYYQQKITAAEPKPELGDVIEDRGYAPATPAPERMLRPPVPIIVTPPPIVVYEGGKDKNAGWDYPTEVNQRDPEHPYVIHQDEFNNGQQGYEQTTYTYWAGDDVLTDTDGHPLPHADLVVGVDNLKWGHGTDDIDVVFVRNDKLNLEMEICRDYRSYEEEILGRERPPEEDGLEHSSQSRPARKKKRPQ